MSHYEKHKIDRIGVLRAGVLGANDGIISTSSLILGVASAGSSHNEILTAAIAGLVAGALSMAAGEYVSVSSQADTENADILKETRELQDEPEAELLELTHIYMKRGLNKELAKEVAKQLTQHDALGAHLRDELGLVEVQKARPLVAAISSAITFAIGASLPLAVLFFSPVNHLVISESIFTLITLFLLGGFAAKIGGAPFIKGAIRVTFWGSIAMIFTSLIGKFFNVTV